MSDTSLRPRRSKRGASKAASKRGASGRRPSRALGVVGVLGELLITAGVLVFLFLGWYFGVHDAQQRAEQNETAAAMSDQWTVPKPAAPEPEPAVVPAPEFGEGYAVLKVPRFGSDYATVIAEGAVLSVLEQHIGHFEGTAQPGEIGNFAVAGHRTTWGRPLNLIHELVPNDALVVETADGWYTYRYRSGEIVKPQAMDVLLPVPRQPGVEPTEAMITLVACHPMFSARERFIGYGALESFTPRVDGPPASLAAPDGA
ncbi:class E sortase [Salinibacterium sp. ZJ454]|uniref:class E sortase n=1 Tax=Salinibacterium sp. ZJ454 TaxID=2708339 RepID=UPI00142434E9|nr:class E sortase [Salinibacterium sp. ZJ454]